MNTFKSHGALPPHIMLGVFKNLIGGGGNGLDS
jgi:hypothetical protein